jgi:hypothetical protein
MSSSVVMTPEWRMTVSALPGVSIGLVRRIGSGKLRSPNAICVAAQLIGQSRGRELPAFEPARARFGRVVEGVMRRLWFRGRAAALTAAVIGLAIVTSAAQAATDRAGAVGGWAAFRDDAHGFRISYPAAVFTLLHERADVGSEDGLALISRDGRARLLAESFWNEARESLSEYRARVLTEIYPGARLDYAPTRDTWFVVSGIKDGLMFYHRTSFTCGGRMVSSWAMAYPLAERAVYDRIVEGIARRYRAGRGADDDCRLPPVAAAEPEAATRWPDGPRARIETVPQEP